MIKINGEDIEVVIDRMRKTGVTTIKGARVTVSKPVLVPFVDCISRASVNELVDELARRLSDERCGPPIRGREPGVIMHNILDLPSVEPERKKGKWRVECFNVWCTNCGFHPKAIEAIEYCPKCGAEMEVEG